MNRTQREGEIMKDYQQTIFRNQFGLPEEAKEDGAMGLIAKRIAWVALGYLAIHLVVYLRE